MDITLLGPQRRVAGARAAVAELIPEGPVATINAGWRERESDTSELDGVLGGRMVNLELYRVGAADRGGHRVRRGRRGVPGRPQLGVLAGLVA